MRYRSFIITNYRAIKGPLVIDVRKKSLVPIIGVNECGKTTILHALFAMDSYNDTLNHNGRHLQDVENLYRTAPDPPVVSAEIEISRVEIRRALRELGSDVHWKDHPDWRRYLNSRPPLPDSLTIQRNLRTRLYSLSCISSFSNQELNHALAEKIISQLPYILYFDDFQDSIPDRVEIPTDRSAESDWLAILETLFEKTDHAFSVYDLPSKEERQRKTILSKVKRRLNETLTREWRNFRLDDSKALEISIEYVEEKYGEQTRSYLKFDIVEFDANGDEHFFFVRDRSKGFYWFFNFVMKLEFNPKVVENGDVDAIYILDEPGSYLHALAQERLCRKLRQLSQENHVIYCTHSHHLLNPEVIPLSSVKIAEKDRQGTVSLVSIYDHRGTITEKHAAYQPLLDALQVRPFVIDISRDLVVIVEGIVDFYLLELFKGGYVFRTLPSVGAKSMKFYISIMIAWRVPYRALWDNDVAGRAAVEDAAEHFGPEEAKGRFLLIPLTSGRSSNRIAQDLVDGEDLKNIRVALSLPSNTSFDKTVSTLFYYGDRDRIVASLRGRTSRNFDVVFKHLAVEGFSG